MESNYPILVKILILQFVILQSFGFKRIITDKKAGDVINIEDLTFRAVILIGMYATSLRRVSYKFHVKCPRVKDYVFIMTL